MPTTELAPDITIPSDTVFQDVTAPDIDPTVIELVLPTSAEEVKDYTLLHVDPDELVIGPNVRLFDPQRLEDPQDEEYADFVADLLDQGNTIPIIARYDAHGQLIVIDGQVRTYGLRKAKKRATESGEVSWKKAFVIAQAHGISDEKATAIERMVEQHGANFLRFAMTQADQLRTVQGLLELGVEPVTVGKRLRLKNDDAAVLMAVAQSTHAAELAHQGVLGLSESAVIAEFEAYGDESAAVEELTECAQTNPGQIHNIAQRLRVARTERVALAAAAAELAEQGLTVIEPPDTLRGPQIRQLADLRPTAKTKPGGTLSIKRHATCPGHAAYLTFHRVWPDKEGTVTVIHVCTDFQRHKHAERNAEPGKTLIERPTYPTGSAVQTGPMTAEQKRYRKTVIAQGKAWDSATIKRMEALELFAKRRTLSQAEDTWLEAMRASSARYADAAGRGHRLALTLLGWDSKFAGNGNRAALRAEILKAKPERARVISMVMVLAALEQGVSRRRTWENPNEEEIAYFAKLRTLKLQTLEPSGPADWVPSEVEMLVLDRSEPVDAALAAAVEDEIEVEATLDDEDPGADDEPLADGEDLPTDGDATEVSDAR
ncbi:MULTISPECIES: hypothetical protein [unclassified Crossiella]|uniref:hypothetical protein n=1 Tax=unclassified Crossiella TaxID=2620835 RepID=UPI00200001EF|nr:MULTISPECIES: hypothetical protein [unclassified Crossiella]MCK2240058.1 hypothetical protein [Crossiella sp. S99.2]MCK2252766.1 hypothetical protein [Crossiella sp. S99.1]